MTCKGDEENELIDFSVCVFFVVFFVKREVERDGRRSMEGGSDALKSMIGLGRENKLPS